jgi:hypothetical protein
VTMKRAGNSAGALHRIIMPEPAIQDQ